LGSSGRREPTLLRVCLYDRFFQRRTDYNQTQLPTTMVGNLEDAVKGNNNTKIVHLLELLKMQLDRIEEKIEGLE
jgi:hypothetical protein